TNYVQRRQVEAYGPERPAIDIDQVSRVDVLGLTPGPNERSALASLQIEDGHLPDRACAGGDGEEHTAAAGEQGRKVVIQFAPGYVRLRQYLGLAAARRHAEKPCG